MKKLLAMVLALVMTLSLAVSANALKADEKINEDYAEAVAVLDGMGVFKGYEDGSFKPENKITRAEVATIIYRIYTADVAKNDKSGLYATYNKFSDMAGAGWAAGYIGYCANAEFVKGYPDGTFKPSGNVTGYEVLAMILRAVGYDKNNEFTGADWALNVAKYAEQLGILKNVAKTTDLSAPATRELVAEILFRAIQSPMVTYTAAFGYQNVGLNGDKDGKTFKNNVSLGEKNFELDSKDDHDEWGRVTKVWTYTSGNEETVLVATPKASYHETFAACDLCKEINVKSVKVVSKFVNGVESKVDYTYDARDTKDNNGAQGQLVEFYKVEGGYREVVIDTYLAKVTDVLTEKTDRNSHVVRDAYMVLDAYTHSYNRTGVAETIYVKGNDYAEGDYVLVNVNENEKNEVSIIAGPNTKITAKYVEVVGKAESFTGAQSAIWYNADKHSIDGKDYDDAYTFYLDYAKNDKNCNVTWFLDQYGNLIGDTKVTNNSYAVLKDIRWIDGTPGYAEATLVYMDGKDSAEKVSVKSIDGVPYVQADEVYTGPFNVTCTPTGERYADSVGFNDVSEKAYVGRSSQWNDVYEGVALYLVENNSDGTVNLVGIGEDARNPEVKYANNVTIDKSASVILNAQEGDSTRIGYNYITDETKFLVRTTDAKGEYVYNAFNRNDMPQFVFESCEIYYVQNEDGFVSNVYIKNSLNENDFGNYIFVMSSQVKETIVDKANNIFGINVLVSGKSEPEFVTGSYEIIHTLARNAGKLFSAQWYNTAAQKDQYGDLLAVDLVNEGNDSDRYVRDQVVADYVRNGKFVNGNTIVSDGMAAWTIDANTKIYVDDTTKKAGYDQLTLDDLKDLFYIENRGIWVVTNGDARYGVADAVYVGTKLRTNATGTFEYKYGDNKTAEAEFQYITADGGKNYFEITLDPGVNAVPDSGFFNAADENATLNYTDGDPWWLTVTVNDKNGKALYKVADHYAKDLAMTGSIVVTAEDGYTRETYKWKIENGRQLCTSTELTYKTKSELARTYDIDIQDETVTVYLQGNNTVTVGQLMEVLYVRDGAEKCTHATIAPYDSQSGTAAVLSDLLKAGQADFFLTVTPESGPAVNYTVNIIA